MIFKFFFWSLDGRGSAASREPEGRSRIETAGFHYIRVVMVVVVEVAIVIVVVVVVIVDVHQQAEVQDLE